MRQGKEDKSLQGQGWWDRPHPGRSDYTSGDSQATNDSAQHRTVNRDSMKLRVRFVQSHDGYRLACYERGSGASGTVLALHGFGSSALHTWGATQWLKQLAGAGMRVVAFDFRGHGKSGKPNDPSAYSLAALQHDALTVAAAFDIERCSMLAYSMGSRVAWELMVHHAQLFTKGVLGGMSKERPLARLQPKMARELVAEHITRSTVEGDFSRHASAGADSQSQMRRQYGSLLNREGNDTNALIALVEGMQHEATVDLRQAPQQPTLFAAGEFDGLRQDTEELATMTPQRSVLILPHRNHVNAPGSPVFKRTGTAFLREQPDDAVSVD